MFDSLHEWNIKREGFLGFMLLQLETSHDLFVISGGFFYQNCICRIGHQPHSDNILYKDKNTAKNRKNSKDQTNTSHAA